MGIKVLWLCLKVSFFGIPLFDIFSFLDWALRTSLLNRQLNSYNWEAEFL